MFEILCKEKLCEGVTRITVSAPLAARRAEAGQFVILRAEEEGERIPLTIAGCDRERGTVSVIYQTVGATTMALDAKNVGDCLPGVTGPLGMPTRTEGFSRVLVAGGGVGCAIALPVAKKLHENGAEVTSVIGFRSRKFVMLEKEFCAQSDRLFVLTDDGSYGERGNVCAPLVRLLGAGERFDAVFAVGPLIMMKSVAEATRPYKIPTVASMNPIMIDGTGMCGCCRVRVNGEMKFACVDGPDFDAHAVDFDEAIARNTTYRDFELRAREHACNLLKKGEN